MHDPGSLSREAHPCLQRPSPGDSEPLMGRQRGSSPASAPPGALIERINDPGPPCQDVLEFRLSETIRRAVTPAAINHNYFETQ